MAGYIDVVIFWRLMDFVPVEIHKRAKKEHGQFPAILTSRVVNNPYLFDKEMLTSKDLKIFQNIWWKEHSVVEDLITDLSNVDSWVDAAADINYNICAKNLFHINLQKE